MLICVVEINDLSGFPVVVLISHTNEATLCVWNDDAKVGAEYACPRARVWRQVFLRAKDGEISGTDFWIAVYQCSSLWHHGYVLLEAYVCGLEEKHFPTIIISEGALVWAYLLEWSDLVIPFENFKRLFPDVCKVCFQVWRGREAHLIKEWVVSDGTVGFKLIVKEFF